MIRQNTAAIVVSDPAVSNPAVLYALADLILLAVHPGIIMIITGDSDINAIIAIRAKESRKRESHGICNRHVYYSTRRAQYNLVVTPWPHCSALMTICGHSGYILGSTLRLRYSSQYEMRGQISQSGGNSGAIAADAHMHPFALQARHPKVF